MSQSLVIQVIDQEEVLASALISVNGDLTHHAIETSKQEMVAALKKKLKEVGEISSCVDEVAESFSAIEFDKETVKKIDDLGLYEKHLFDLEGRFTILGASDLLRGLIFFYNKEILTQSVEVL